MKVSKWGNSLAIRIPADMAAKLGVKEGDELYTIPGMSEEQLTIMRKPTRAEMWARLDESAKMIQWPADYKFDREEANSRGR